MDSRLKKRIQGARKAARTKKSMALARRKLAEEKASKRDLGPPKREV